MAKKRAGEMPESMKNKGVVQVKSTEEMTVVINLFLFIPATSPFSLLLPTIINLNRIESPKNIPLTTYPVLNPD